MKSYLYYMSVDSARRKTQGPTTHIAGDQLQPVLRGDRVWVVTYTQGRLWVVCRFDVDHKTGLRQARRELGTTDVWPSKVHLFAAEGESHEPKLVDFTNEAKHLRFISKTDRLPDPFTHHNLRTMRELEPSSDGLLEKAWRLGAPSELPSDNQQALDLVRGREYRRRDELHSFFGGQQQGGISTPASHPVVLLFTGDEGARYGYRDGFRDNGVFEYTGEGQVGDMEMVRGNLAIRDHDANGKALHLFESRGGGVVRYIGEAVYGGYRKEMRPDRRGASRTVIVFQLELLSDGDASADVPDLRLPAPRDAHLWKQSLESLRRAAIEGGRQASETRDARATTRARSEAVRVYAIRRAAGSCEGCTVDAPFSTPAGRPYLEVHHITRMADAGPDHPRWVVALCPNCHRRVHHGDDGLAYARQLDDRVRELEARSVHGA